MSERTHHAATLDGDFVVFLIGMRINEPLKVHRWLPVMRAMTRMLRELAAQPDSGFLHGEYWLGRTTLAVQYWRSRAQLFAFARDSGGLHVPAWRAFNEAIGRDGSVGLWHETYEVAAGAYENTYVSMPPFGLGRAGARR